MSANFPSAGLPALPLTVPTPDAQPQWIAQAARKVNDLSDRYVRPGTVKMVRISDSTNSLSSLANWVVFKPEGGTLDISGTTTQGLQEAVNYAFDFGHSLVVYGGTTKAASSFGAYDGQAPSLIQASTTIEFPPMQLGRVEIRDVSIISSASIGVRFDSMIACVVDLCWGGQIVMAAANDIGVKFSPRNGVPQDSAFGVGIGGTCTVRVGSVVVPTGGTGGPILFDRSAGFIGFSNKWTFSEPNGGAVGIDVNDGAFAFTENEITGLAVHGQTNQCVRIGHGAHPELIADNRWFLDCHPATGGVGIDISSSGGDYINCSVNAGTNTGAVGIKLETVADANIIDVSRISGCTTPIQDLSTTRGNSIRGHDDHVETDLNGTNQTGIATGTFTKVLWAAPAYNTNAANGTWDATNKRWIPGPGKALISARVVWVATTDQAQLYTAIYKNGAQLRGATSTVFASGIAGGQGVHISCVVMSDNATDYFEIFARQDTGVNQDIIGETHSSWVNFTRLF